jgi:hypothetical protein
VPEVGLGEAQLHAEAKQVRSELAAVYNPIGHMNSITNCRLPVSSARSIRYVHLVSICIQLTHVIDRMQFYVRA